MELFAKGIRGQLKLSGNTVSILRKGVWFGPMSQDLEINIDAITAISFKAAGTFAQGSIKILWPGAQDDGYYGRYYKSCNPKTVMFVRSQMKEFVAIKEAIEKRMAEREANAFKPESSANDLLKFADLLSQKLITQAEFDTQKAKILAA